MAAHRITITLDAEHASKLARLAARVHVDEGTLARSLLSSAIDDADPDAGTVVAVLDGIEGAWDRAQLGRRQAASGDTVTLEQLSRVARVEIALAAVDDLDRLIAALSLPADTRERVRRSLRPLADVPRVGARMATSRITGQHITMAAGGGARRSKRPSCDGLECRAGVVRRLWIHRRSAASEGYACGMSEHARSLLHEALSLSAEERADLIAELLVSLEGAAADETVTVEQAWAEELETRAGRVLSGQGHGEEWTQVRARVSRSLTDG